MRSKIKKNHEFFELSKFRRRFMLLVLLTLFCILFSRAFFLQGMQKDFLQQEGFERSNRNIELYAYRGKIYDRNNQILAASETVRSITMEPNRVEFKKGDKNKLANLLGVKIKFLNKKSKSKRNHIYLKRKVDPKIASKILALKIPGISTEKDYRRTYPDQEISAHVVGFSGEIEFDSTKPDGTPRKLMNVSKLNDLGWRSKTDLKRGVQYALNDFVSRMSTVCENTL